MTPLIIIFTPFVRLLFHSLAASCGFSCIALIAILPVQVIRWVSIYTIFSQQQISLFESIESGILYLDAVLLIFVILIYSGYFVFEQGRALWTMIKSETQASQATLKSQAHQAQAGGATSP